MYFCFYALNHPLKLYTHLSTQLATEPLPTAVGKFSSLAFRFMYKIKYNRKNIRSNVGICRLLVVLLY